MLRLLVGLLRPSRGEALVFGVPSSDPEARRRVGFMPADPAFYSNLTGMENLDLLASLQGAEECPDRRWAAELLSLEERDLRRPVGGYSSGMIQKLGIIQAVQHRPSLVVLDEPANRLDPIARRSFEEMVRHIAARGGTVVLSSHQLAEVERTCDTVAMIRRARLLTVEAVASLRSKALRRVTARLKGDPGCVPPELLEPVVENGLLKARLQAGKPHVIAALAADPAVEDLLVEPASLEETFVHLYSEQAPE